MAVLGLEYGGVIITKGNKGSFLDDRNVPRLDYCGVYTTLSIY